MGEVVTERGRGKVSKIERIHQPLGPQSIMDSSSWAVAEHTTHPAAEDDFQQFLDMNGLGSMSDGINYNYQDFQSSTASQMLQPNTRDHLDLPMSGTDAPMILSPAVTAMQHQIPTITTAGPYQSIPATMMPPPTPSEALVDSIDAQIQFLQQQKIRHQQRQLEEQQAAFFVRQHSRMVPPTPQSLEIQPSTSQYYAQPSPAEQQQQQTVDYRYQRLKDASDVCWDPLLQIRDRLANTFLRCPLLRSCLQQSHHLRHNSRLIPSSLCRAPTLALSPRLRCTRRLILSPYLTRDTAQSVPARLWTWNWTRPWLQFRI